MRFDSGRQADVLLHTWLLSGQNYPFEAVKVNSFFGKMGFDDYLRYDKAVE